MIKFEIIQSAANKCKYEYFKNSLIRPGHMRTRERSTEKQLLLVQAVKNAYIASPPEIKYIKGEKTIFFPWIC